MDKQWIKVDKNTWTIDQGEHDFQISRDEYGMYRLFTGYDSARFRSLAQAKRLGLQILSDRNAA